MQYTGPVPCPAAVVFVRQAQSSSCARCIVCRHEKRYRPALSPAVTKSSSPEALPMDDVDEPVDARCTPRGDPVARASGAAPQEEHRPFLGAEMPTKWPCGPAVFLAPDRAWLGACGVSPPGASGPLRPSCRADSRASCHGARSCRSYKLPIMPPRLNREMWCQVPCSSRCRQKPEVVLLPVDPDNGCTAASRARSRTATCRSRK